MINAAVSDHSDVFTRNKINSPCPYKQTKQSQDTGPRPAAESSSARSGALFWPEPTAISRHGGGHGRTRDHTNPSAFGRAQLSCWAAVWAQAEPRHSWLQRQENLPGPLRLLKAAVSAEECCCVPRVV